MSLDHESQTQAWVLIAIVMICAVFWFGVSILAAQIPYAIISMLIVGFSRFAMGVYIVWGLGVLLARR